MFRKDGLTPIPVLRGSIGGNPLRAGRAILADQRGAALALMVLLLPLWLALAALAIDVAYLIWVHAGMRAAADLGALAAAQNLDLEALADGDPQLIPGPTRRDAWRWIEENLRRHTATRPWADGAEIQVWVLNGKPEAPIRHPLTRRVLADPTVAVQVSLRARGPFLPQRLGLVPLQVRADASVMGRQR